MLRELCTVTIFLAFLSFSNGAPVLPHPELMYMTDFHEEPMGPVEFIYAPPELEPLTEGRQIPILEDESEEVVPIKLPRMEDEEDDDDVDSDDEKEEDLDDEEDEDEDDDKEGKEESERSDSDFVKTVKNEMRRNQDDEELDELADNEDAFFRSDISLMPVYIESTPESNHKPLADDADDDEDEEEDADDEESGEERSDKRGRVLFNHSGINDSYGWYGYPEHKNNWGRHYGHDYNHGDKILYHHGFYTAYY